MGVESRVLQVMSLLHGRSGLPPLPKPCILDHIPLTPKPRAASDPGAFFGFRSQGWGFGSKV